MIVIAAVLILAAAVPKFDDFRASAVFEGTAASPKLTTARQRKLAAQIRRQATKPANFASHLRVAEWGCGTSCVSFALVDLRTGRVYDAPFLILGYGAPYK